MLFLLTNKQVNPEDVVSVKAIRNAMGITYEPVEIKVEDETGETEPENNAVTERSSPTNASHSEVRLNVTKSNLFPCNCLNLLKVSLQC